MISVRMVVIIFFAIKSEIISLFIAKNITTTILTLTIHYKTLQSLQICLDKK